jgi:hypothetical protein
VQSPVAPAIANGDLRACNTLIHEINVVLVPAGALTTATATAAAVPAPAPAPVPQNVATVAAVPAPQQVTQVVTTREVLVPVKQVQQQQVQAQAASVSSNVDITKINANVGGLHNPFG